MVWRDLGIARVVEARARPVGPSGAAGAARRPVVVHNPPLFAAGPCATQEQAKRAAADANAMHGGPGFLVEDRDGELSDGTHAYYAEESAQGEWFVVLKEMPSARMVLL